MARPRPSRHIGACIGFCLLCLGLMALKLMPLNPASIGWAGPDLVTCAIFAWMLRRPDELPSWLVALVALTADLLYQRPPGLMAALVLIGAEMLRRQAWSGRPLAALAEWGGIWLLMGGMALINWMVLALFLPVAPGLGALLAAAASNALAYPVMVGCLWLLGLRRPALAARGDRI